MKNIVITELEHHLDHEMIFTQRIMTFLSAFRFLVIIAIMLQLSMISYEQLVEVSGTETLTTRIIVAKHDLVISKLFTKCCNKPTVFVKYVSLNMYLEMPANLEELTF